MQKYLLENQKNLLRAISPSPSLLRSGIGTYNLHTLHSGCRIWNLFFVIYVIIVKFMEMSNSVYLVYYLRNYTYSKILY